MTRPKAGWAALVAALGIALTACSPGTSRETAAAPALAQSTRPSQQSGDNQTVSLATGDYYFMPSEITVRPGTLTVTVLNEGPRRHTFFVRNLADTDDIVKGNDRLVAGESETVTLTLTDVGRYKMYCAIPGHADRGEIGFINVAS